MVFSKELGYDPDEWEECSEDERFVLFGFYTRMFLTLTSVGFTLFFFWLIEARKQLEQSEEEKKLSDKNVDKEKVEELKAVKEKLEKLGVQQVARPEQTAPSFSKEETEALEEWQREVARLEETRLQDLEGHMTDASGGMSDIDTESQLIDRLMPADRISMDTDSTEMEQFRPQSRKDRTPPPSRITPSHIFAVQADICPVPDVDDVEARLIASIQDAASTIVTGSEQIERDTGSTNGWEAPPESEFMAEQAAEFIYKPGEVGEGIRTSTDSEDDFVKVYKDELIRNGTGMVQEQIIEPSGKITDGAPTFTITLPGTTFQKTPEHWQEEPMKVIPGAAAATVYISKTDQQQAGLEFQEAPRKPEEGAFEFIPSTTVQSMTTEGTFAPIRHGTEETFVLKVGGVEGLVGVGREPKREPERPPSEILTTAPREPLTEDERKRIAEAEMYVHDAIEYVAANGQSHPEPSIGFVVEEGMLDSIGQSDSAAVVAAPPAQQQQQQQQQQPPVSAVATSQMIRTNEVFEKVEEPMEIDDAMTYAPEIQSIEIPPDQASINSENLLEYFDQVAAECTDVFNLPLPQTTRAAAAGTSISKPLESSQSFSSLRSTKSITSSGSHPRMRKQSSLLSVLGVTSLQEMLLALTSLEDLSDAMRKAGLQSSNLIFGIDYTASNKYQGEHCFEGRSLHSLDVFKENPYQQVIKIMGRTLAPFATSGYIPAYGFGDAKTSDWSVFKLKPEEGECKDFDEVLRVYDSITPTISLSGPTNFAPLIYQAIEICEKVQDYHILVIVADGQVTNEKATRKAIVQACQHPLSIIVVGVGDGPWDMMKVFDESLPKRPWDNFHFVEFHELMKKADNVDAGELSFAVQSLLEVPDQYNIIRQLGLLRSFPPIPKQNQ